ncbi:ketoreductase [Plectosphaerella plurivora]|uniref:Ketoreductase n=1 Tax=Plectosphaerella plurivora TaxID=936078 RepID=A0A9P8VB75_9PEZI|nr:ketoreductase [Plectosphaerella plurivora]
MKTLLTGGTGFLGGHVLDTLLERGHTVLTTVRSEEKGKKLLADYPDTPKDKLDFVVIPDVASPGAFSGLGSYELEAVHHVASPFHYDVKDIQKELIDPAVLGTTGILKAIKESCPAVKSVVITSSFVAIIDMGKAQRGEDKTYSEADWNPVTLEQALSNPNLGYMASKTFAEKAAWEFVEKEKPGFTLSTICPPMIYGPVKSHAKSLDSVNTSNQFLAEVLQGKHKDGLPPTSFPTWVDVRDVALAHVLAMEREEAAGKRFLVAAGNYSNVELAKTVYENFPDLREKLPEEKNFGGAPFPAPHLFGLDTSRVEKILGIKYIPYEKTVIDAVKSFK